MEKAELLEKIEKGELTETELEEIAGGLRDERGNFIIADSKYYGCDSYVKSTETTDKRRYSVYFPNTCCGCLHYNAIFCHCEIPNPPNFELKRLRYTD
jgi:hypothetical protein